MYNNSSRGEIGNIADSDLLSLFMKDKEECTSLKEAYIQRVQGISHEII
jgi:hypothetical protein